MSGVIYEFEDVGDDLPRPPMAAMRGFLAAGVVLSPKGWSALSSQQRRAFVVAGSASHIDVMAIQAAVRNASVSEVRLVPRVTDPDPMQVPDSLAAALGPHARITAQKWTLLRPVDRYVLATLALNTRLLFRALREIMPEDTATELPWKAAVAHAEVTMRPDTLDKLRSPKFLDGRAFVLARVAGVRAARRAQETFDIRSERTTGTIELDWAPLDEPGAVVWQAHVSSWDGSFFAAAALAAASTAAVALTDMIAEEDGSAAIGTTKIVEEPWMVGSDVREQPTTLFSGNEIRKSLAENKNVGQTLRMNDPGDTSSRLQPPPPAPSSSKLIPQALPGSGGTRAVTNVTSSQSLPRVTATVPPTMSRRQEAQQIPLLLWVLLGLVAVMLAALVGIILALVNMRR